MKLYDPFSAALEAVQVSDVTEALSGVSDVDLIALERKEAADELARQQEVRRLEAKAERERREARQQPKALPEVPAPDLVAR